MNSAIHKIVLAVGLYLQMISPMAAEPVSVAISKLKQTQQLDTQLSGVLGYAHDCSFALYPDRLSALTREATGAVMIVADKDANAISEGTPLKAYVNAYVLAKGKLRKGPNPGDVTALKHALIYYSFSDPYKYSAKKECVSMGEGSVLKVEELLQRSSLESGASIKVLGVLKKEDEIYRLYSSSETADGNVWSYAIDILFKPGIEFCLNRDLVVEGFPRTPRRRTGVKLELINAVLAADACSRDIATKGADN